MATVEEICRIADENGIGNSFRAIIAAVTPHGLIGKPHQKSIRFAPPQDKRHYLLTIWADPIGENGGIRYDMYPDGFAKFYSVSAEESRRILGNGERYVVEEIALEEVPKLIRAIDDLFDLIHYRKIGRTPLETIFKGFTVKYDDVIKALRDFDGKYPNLDDYDQWIEKEGYKYALNVAGRLYPPKHILSVVTGIDVSQFSGGDQTNRVFQQLGMVIVDKHGISPALKLLAHTTYLLTWNPGKFAWEDFQEDWNALYMGSRPRFRWSCGNTRSIEIGDRVFLMRLGYREIVTGIVASGVVTELPFEDANWNIGGISPSALYIEFEPDILLNPDIDDLLDPKIVSQDFNWHPRSSGITIPNEIAVRLEQVWQRHVQRTTLPEVPEKPVETKSKTYSEGSRRLVANYRYERDPRAREDCIVHHGTRCSVCGFDFGEKFGALGEGFIHVHHLTPMSERDVEYVIDPIKDLRPVCPNCHAMLHRKSPPYSIEELRYIRQQIGKG